MSTDATRRPPAELAARHHKLYELSARTIAGDIQAVLNLGAGVVLHGNLEPLYLEPVLRLLDPAVRSELEAEHGRLEADLQLLADLADSDPDSGDVELLARTLLTRLREHLRRDERTLYRPLDRLLAAGSESV